ncbi:MAG: DNA (cytosine-5-)-methyltransferase [Halieaceae bacterium]|nr:DNA (cytosine-5-)-methyltransferase [Halieaceae bacterium]
MIKPRVLDLFCGCGGMSLGFEAAGFEIALAIDNWEKAILTYNHNHPSPVGEVLDISEFDDDRIDSLLSRGTIDGVIGGPPCQGFSTVGTRDVDDPRNFLYQEYCRIVEKIQPKFFVIENVQGMLTLGGGFFRKDIEKRFGELGYSVNFTILNAAEFGIPQSRKRVFFVGILNGPKFKFPTGESIPDVNTKDALSDLPELDIQHEGIHKFPYPGPPATDYQRYIRGSAKSVTEHLITMHTEQTKSIIGMIPDGGKIRDLPSEYWEVRKYNKAFQRMPSEGVSATVDTGHRNYFHYRQNRIPTVRENARLQSFKDDWVPQGSKTSQYKQIGNAVPPLLAENVARTLKKYL